MAPERLGAAAKEAEDAGFDEVWVSEDFFFSGGIAGAGAGACGHTRDQGRPGRGIGLRSPPCPARDGARHAGACLSRTGSCPGSAWAFRPGWTRWASIHASPMTAIRECVTIVRALLDGDELDVDGRMFSLRQARLDHAAGRAPPDRRSGVVGPKLLALSGSIADGSVLSVLGGRGLHPVCAASASTRVARRLAGPTLIGSRPLRSTRCRATGRPRVEPRARRSRSTRRPAARTRSPKRPASRTELQTLVAEGVDAVRDGMPEDWVERLTVSGDPDEVVAQI